jgi:hypothetical protein
MELIIAFFRDVLSGWLYFVNFTINLIIILACVGVMGDKKKAEIQKAIREKKEYELVTGISAKKAALEGKQIISVEEDEKPKEPAAEEKVSEVLELNSEPEKEEK